MLSPSVPENLEARLYPHLDLACASGEIGAEVFRSGMPEDRTIRNEGIGRDGKATYLAHGKVDSSGTKRWRERVVPGARIELATPAFSGRRSTNELPRHRRFRNCRG